MNSFGAHFSSKKKKPLKNRTLPFPFHPQLQYGIFVTVYCAVQSNAMMLGPHRKSSAKMATAASFGAAAAIRGTSGGGHWPVNGPPQVCACSFAGRGLIASMLGYTAPLAPPLLQSSSALHSPKRVVILTACWHCIKSPGTGVRCWPGTSCKHFQPVLNVPYGSFAAPVSLVRAFHRPWGAWDRTFTEKALLHLTQYWKASDFQWFEHKCCPI